MLTSTASRMAVLFESDESISHEGFSANYVVLDAATGRERLQSSISYTYRVILVSETWFFG